MAGQRQLPSYNPYLNLPNIELSDHARRLQEALLERRPRTRKERFDMATDCALRCSCGPCT
jgi:hypothetical protein